MTTYNGVIYENGVVTGYDSGTILANVTIESSYDGYTITSIGDNAFRNCSSLTSIIIPASITQIGTNAFVNSGLTTIYYTGTVEQWNTITIGSDAIPQTVRKYLLKTTVIELPEGSELIKSTTDKDLVSTYAIKDVKGNQIDTTYIPRTEFDTLVDQKITEVDTKIAGVETKVAEVKNSITTANNKIAEVESSIPTVYDWAKQETKPTYTADEVGALSDTTYIPTKTSDLSNDSGFITSYTETDPTVPEWAKQENKPTYTATEVGALPNTTRIPTQTSDLTNNGNGSSNFVTFADIENRALWYSFDSSTKTLAFTTTAPNS